MEVSGMGKEKLPRWQVATRVGILLGLLLLVAGLVVRDIRARALVRTDYVAMALWAAGIILTVGGAVVNFRMFANLVRGRRAAEGANFAVVVLLSLGLAGLLCYVSTRRFVRMDWTGKRTYTLHSKTVNILRGLDRDIEATIVYAPDPRVERAISETRDMLDEFKAISSHVTVRELNWMVPEDSQKWEQLQQRLGGANDADFAVVFTTAESHAIVPLQQTVTATYEAVDFTGEDAFATALSKLTEGKKATVYFLTGHGERPLEGSEPGPMAPDEAGTMRGAENSLSLLAKSLQRDNYETKPLNLSAVGSVPEDCAALVIAGPRTPLPDAELKALKSYFDTKNGSAVILLDPKVVSGTQSNLQSLLSQYGITAHTEAVGITNAQVVLGMLQKPDVPVSGYGMADHQITSDLRNYTVTLQFACPLEVAEPPPDAPPKAQKLLSGPAGPQEQSWGETSFQPDSRSPAQYNAGQDIPPPLVVGAVVAPQTPPQAGPVPPEWMGRMPGPKLVVIGSSLSFVNAAIEVQPANLYLLQNSINWMAGRLHMLGIPAKTLEFTQVPVSESQVAAARYIFIGGLPASIIVLGIAVWVMRRR
jgi:hypothetical protein